MRSKPENGPVFTFLMHTLWAAIGSMGVFLIWLSVTDASSGWWLRLVGGVLGLAIAGLGILAVVGMFITAPRSATYVATWSSPLDSHPAVHIQATAEIARGRITSLTRSVQTVRDWSEIDLEASAAGDGEADDAGTWAIAIARMVVAGKLKLVVRERVTVREQEGLEGSSESLSEWYLERTEGSASAVPNGAEGDVLAAMLRKLEGDSYVPDLLSECLVDEEVMRSLRHFVSSPTAPDEREVAKLKTLLQSQRSGR